MIDKKILKILKNKKINEDKISKIKKVTKSINKFLIHIDEVLFVLFCTSLSFLLAYSTWVLDPVLNSQIDASLQKSISELRPVNWKKIISKRKVWCDVENSFYCWYCAYWAALISKDFFPYITKIEQYRTRWWNAWQRCENAKEAWFKIWNKPTQWALVVFKEWKRYSQYWHVWRLISYKNWSKRWIIRDMNYTKRYEMTDRRFDTNDKDIKCYIYNKTQNPEPKKEINTLKNTTKQTTEKKYKKQQNNENTKPQWNNNIIYPNNEKIIYPNNYKKNTNITTEKITNITSITKKTETDTKNIVYYKKNIQLNFDSSDPITKRFLRNNEITAYINTTENNEIKQWDLSELVFKIKDKQNNNKKFSWILPFGISIINSNDSITTKLSYIKFISNWEIRIPIKANKIWNASIILKIWTDKIAKINLNIIDF